MKHDVPLLASVGDVYNPGDIILQKPNPFDVAASAFPGRVRRLHRVTRELINEAALKLT